MPGPLQGIRIVEFVGIGPAPFCAMMLSDMGAEIIRIGQPRSSKSHGVDSKFDVLARGRRALALDLKQPDSRHLALQLIERADALIEGFRPGVMERLGLAPDACMERNPRLVYGRMTGWGQTGPLAAAAGHDLNYIALSGMLHAIGRAGEPPPPPLNLIGDFGGGGMLLAFGVVCALLEARQSKRGQIVDAAMIDGSALLGALFYGLKAAGHWSMTRGENLLDGGAHFYGAYECADGKYVAIGAIEPQFYAEFLQRIGIDEPLFQQQIDRKRWPLLKQKLAEHIKTKTREEWCALLEGTDACFAPVLDMDEAPRHPHNLARETFVEVDGIVQPGPAPRFSRTPTSTPTGASSVADGSRILREWGLDELQIAEFKTRGAL